MPLANDVIIDYDLLSVRAVNALRNAGYKSLLECINLNFDDLLKIRDIGKKTANEILTLIDSIKGRDFQKRSFPEDKYEYWVKVLAIPISKINLSARAMHILKKSRILSLLDLVQQRAGGILGIRDCGRKTVREIEDFLKQLDLQLGEHLEKDFINKVRSYRASKKEDEILNDFKRDYPEKYDVLNKVGINKLGDSRTKFYLDCFREYQEGGTLAYVAKRMHLTRERIRQILTRGTKLSLFAYTGREYHYIEKSKIIDDYSKHLNLNSVAKMNGVSVGYLKRLLTANKITEKELGLLREKAQKNKCIEMYRKIEKELGHSPTTTELQNKSGSWRYLSNKICEIWGSTDAFREELQIPKPIRTFPEATRKWLEKRSRIAFIVRMQNLDQIRDCLTNTSLLSCSEIACECGIKPPRALRLLNLLLARGEIIREGSAGLIKYKLNRE